MRETHEHGDVVQRVVIPGDPKKTNQLFASHVFHHLPPMYLVSELVQTRPPNVPSRCCTCAYGVGVGASGEINDTKDVAIVYIVRWIQAVNRHGTVPIQAASTDPVEIGHV